MIAQTYVWRANDPKSIIDVKIRNLLRMQETNGCRYTSVYICINMLIQDMQIE